MTVPQGEIAVPTRRLARFFVQPALLVSLVGGRFEIVSPLQADLIFEYANYDASRDLIVIFVSHPSFAEVKLGAIVPEIDGPTVHRLSDEFCKEER